MGYSIKMKPSEPSEAENIGGIGDVLRDAPVVELPDHALSALKAMVAEYQVAARPLANEAEEFAKFAKAIEAPRSFSEPEPERAPSV